MDKDYSNLKHLYIRLEKEGDADIRKEWAKDLYEHNKISLKEYNSYLNMDYDAYLKHRKDAIEGKSDGEMAGVHCYCYVLIEDGKMVGSGSIRLNPEDNEELNTFGGHIGYGIIPSKRKQGYGSVYLHLLLKKAQEFGLKEVMVVCDERNLGSSGVIENNFGVIKDIVYNPKRNRNFKRYIIDVDKSIDEFEKRNFKSTAKHI